MALPLLRYQDLDARPGRWAAFWVEAGCTGVGMCWGVMPSGMLRHPFSRLGALSMPGHKNHERRGGSTLVGVIWRSAS